tara:strand:+ start:237 stop:506 length:270 start_codon:yes stop_codon:yes gene_type:complete
MKKILSITLFVFLINNFSFAEKVECHLLSPMQKAIYKAYCQSQLKKAGNSSESSKKTLNLKEKTGKLMKKLKVNTDSKLFKTGKYSEKK